jgi:hypothetical protein
MKNNITHGSYDRKYDTYHNRRAAGTEGRVGGQSLLQILAGIEANPSP